MAITADLADPELPVLVLSGEIDMACADDVVAGGEQLLRDAPNARDLVVDLGQVEFIDSSGLSALLRLRRTAQGRDIAVALRDVPRSVSVLLRLAGVQDVFSMR
jgi:anti-sigma B factor antagonist